MSVMAKIQGICFGFTLCMQEFFDFISHDQWKINNPGFIKQSEVSIKFKDWIIKEVTERPTNNNALTKNDENVNEPKMKDFKTV